MLALHNFFFMRARRYVLLSCRKLLSYCFSPVIEIQGFFTDIPQTKTHKKRSFWCIYWLFLLYFIFRALGSLMKENSKSLYNVSCTVSIVIVGGEWCLDLC